VLRTLYVNKLRTLCDPLLDWQPMQLVQCVCVCVASMFPKNLDELQARVQELPGKVMTSVSDAKEKCSLQ